MKNFSFEHNGETLWYSRSLAVSTILFSIKDDELYVLANKRGQGCEFNRGLWNVPGGFIDFDETAADAAVRETFEETGIRIDPVKLKFIGLDTKPSGVRQTMVAAFYTVIDYDCIESATTEHSEPGEVEEIRWIKTSELSKYKWTNRQINKILIAAEMLAGSKLANSKS